MCLIAFNWQPGSELPLQVWANRDEFFARPAAATDFWPEAPALLAGRDLSAGGTWMGVTRHGRFAALTNFRDPAAAAGTRSRGLLVSDFLLGADSPEVHARRIEAVSGEYGGFSLLLSDADSLWYVGSRDRAARAVTPGWHGLSNAELDTPWPKLRRLLAGVQALPPGAGEDESLALLADTTPAAEDELPDTGVGLAMERLLSPVCIRTAAYGTRNSTWLRLGAGEIIWQEQDHNLGERRDFRFPRLR